VRSGALGLALLAVATAAALAPACGGKPSPTASAPAKK
jgi:hypothetical protein